MSQEHPQTPPADDAGPAGQPGDTPSGYPQAGYPQRGYAEYAPAARPTNTMALISLICSLTGITVLPIAGSIAGVITGHIARRQIAASGEEGSGLAVAGLVIGYVGVGLLLIVGLFFLLAFGSIFAAFFGATMTTGY